MIVLRAAELAAKPASTEPTEPANNQDAVADETTGAPARTLAVRPAARRVNASPLSPSLPTISAEAASLGCRAARPRQPVTALIGSLEVSLQPSGVLRTGTGGVPTAESRFSVIVAGDTFAASLPAHRLERLLSAADARLPRGAALDDLAALVCEAALAPLLQALEAATGVDWLIAGASAAGANAQWSLSLPLLTADDSAASTPLQLAGDLAAMGRLVRWLEQCRPAPLRVPDVLLPLFVELTAVTLPGSTLATLAPGDVLLTGLPEARRAEASLVLAGAAAWPARLNAGRLELTGARTPPNEPQDAGATAQMSERVTGPSGPAHRPALPGETKPPAPAEAAVVALPETAPVHAPVTVTVELGRLALPISEIATIAPGAVLTLQRWAPDSVQLVVGGRCIGAGEIVDVDGWLGVRVTRVGGHDGL